jgi:GNAT superfamily N-acetyltransferase
MNPTSVSAEYLLVAVLPSSATVTAPHGIERANDDREIEQEGEMVVGFGQIRPLDATYSELASLYVDPAHRRRGVGTEIIKELLRRYDDGTLNAKRTTSPSESQPTGGGTVCLLTLQPTVPFYVPHGFRAVAADEEAFRRLPSSVRLEHATGTALSALLGNQLACMVRDPAK